MSLKYFMNENEDLSLQYHCPKCNHSWDHEKSIHPHKSIVYKLCPRDQKINSFQQLNIDLDKLDLIDVLIEKIKKLEKLPEEVTQLKKKITELEKKKSKK
jgi:hypothetical protein